MTKITLVDQWGCAHPFDSERQCIDWLLSKMLSHADIAIEVKKNE